MLGDFSAGQPVPNDFPYRTALAYGAAAFMLVAGAAVEWRRTTARGAAALTAYFALIVVILMNGRVLLGHYTEFVTYESIAIELAIAAGGLIVYATSAKIDPALASCLTRLGQVVFGGCALIFGAAHFVYMNMTAPLVPEWLPPSQELWAYATGLGHIAAGVAILANVQARLAAILLTVMYASFTAELDGYFADTGGTIVVPPIARVKARLCHATQLALKHALAEARAGAPINRIGKAIQRTAKSRGFKVIKNLAGHGIGRSLHEEPEGIVSYFDRLDTRRLQLGQVIAIEPFLSTKGTHVTEAEDGWTLVGLPANFSAQYEHIYCDEGCPNCCYTF